MRSFAFLLLFPVFAACGKSTDDSGFAEGDTDTDADTDADTDTDSDTDTDTDLPGDSATTTPTGEITLFYPQCVDDQDWTGELHTVDPASYAIINFWETNSLDGWSEEHGLAPTADPTNLTLALQETNSIGSVTADEPDGQGKTLFSCAPGDQLQSQDVMTYAIRVYDVSGAMVECCAFGYTPEIVAQGTYVTTGGTPTSASELAQCRTTCTL